MATAVETRYMPEDLLKLGEDEGRFDLIDGQLVERNMGAKSCRVATKMLRLRGLNSVP